MQAVGIAALILHFGGSIGVVRIVFMVVRLVAEQCAKDRRSCCYTDCCPGIALVVPAILVACIDDGLDAAIVDFGAHAVIIPLVPPVTVDVSHVVLVGGDVREAAVLQRALGVATVRPVDIDKLRRLVCKGGRRRQRPDRHQRCHCSSDSHDRPLEYAVDARK